MTAIHSGSSETRPEGAPRGSRRLLKPALISAYLLWTAVLVIGHVNDNFDTLEDVTRFILIGYVGLFLIFLPMLRPLVRRVPLSPGVKYVALCVASAAIVEIAHMISTPFNDSVKIVIGETPPSTALLYVLIDLAVTLPAYVIVFTLVWRRLLTRYGYAPLEFIMLISLGQFIGDANIHLVPGILLIYAWPYVLLIYHLMNIPPYLLMKQEIDVQGLPQERGRYRGFWVVPATYWAYIILAVAVAAAGMLVRELL